MGLYSEKKILILGGKPIASQDIVHYSRQNGAFTIVTDNLPVSGSKAKQEAEEVWDISTADVETICNKVRERKIDSVFTGIHEFNIWKTLDVCDRLNLPFYATREQLIKTSVKSEYKQLFREYEIPVIDEFILSEQNFDKDIKKVEYPVLIKPVDGSGGFGISICYNMDELRKGYQRAIEFSKSKKVLVERYISAKEVTIFYIIQHGKIMLSAMADRYTGNGSKYTIPLPILYTFPSIYLSEYQDKLNDKVINSFKSIGLRDGMVFIQAFIDGENFRLYDIGFRLTGTQEYHILESLCGYNPLKMLVDYSFTGEMGREDISNLVDPFFGGKHACIITFLIRPCVIGSFIGIDKIRAMQGVLKVIKNHQIGEEIPESVTGTLNQVALRVLAVANSRKALTSLITKITEVADVHSVTGESVLLPSIRVEQL